ncbi:MAG: DUF4149 domain-containing protein [Roseateles depolymerans]|uniref:DUF4149 domain-containing protein n=1 Tax=Roseateles depolymerans TaxID=76731 RepID=A0A2W5DSQ5_9BURK|nr:MAG: DUF4149 domain-containing protein [Roseateles depolymerans]
MFVRLQALLAALWGGFLLCVAFAAAPSAFAVLERSQAGLFVGRLFAVDAQVSVVAGLLLVLFARRQLRDQEDAGRAPRVFTAALLLPALALLCTVAGYYGLQPLMEAARHGSGPLPFMTLHGISMAFFAVKGLAVLALAWLLSRRGSS